MSILLEVHVRVHVYGSGPRTRRVCAALVKDALATAVVRSFEEPRTAAAAARGSTIPVILLDARVAVEPAAFARFALERASAAGCATLFDGSLSERIAARRFVDGQAIALEGSALRPPEPIGAWLEEPDPPPPPAPPPGARGVDFHSYGWGPSGFAAASRNLMIGLLRAGVDVNWLHWVPEPDRAEVYPQDRAILEGIETDALRHDRAIVFHPPSHTSGQEYLDAYSRAYVRVPYANITMFETDMVPVQWRRTIETASRLWVPSAFNLETFVAGGVPREMIDLVPLGLEVENLDLDGPTLDLPERRAVAFVSVFEWTYRKGWDILLRAWAQAFTRSDDVCLFVRTSFRALDIEATIRNYLRGAGFDPARVAPIVVLPKKLSQADLAALYRSADAYILPTRGEGFGLPYLEAMALGLPVIGTAWSGMTDFVDARTGYLIDARLVQITSPLITRIVPIYKDQRWAEPSVPGTVAQLRRVFEQRDEARAIGARGTAVARTQFNRTRIGRLAAAAIERIEPKRRLARAKGSAGRLTFAGDLYALDGTGADARGLIDALDVERFEIAVPWDGDGTWIGFVERLDAHRIKEALAREPAPDRPSIVAAAPARLIAPAGGRPAIARTVATAATLDPRVIAALREFDELWVPSQFSVERFAAAGLDPARIAIVPQAIDADLWTPQTGGVEVSNTHTALRMITLVDWSERSGWDIAMSAFMRAFEPTDDVSLSVKIISVDPRAPLPNFQGDFIAMVERALPHRAAILGSYPLHVATGMTQYSDFARYCSSFDVLVCAAREIGWGRPILEAMANGTAVVAPRYGNHRAFTSEENAFLYDAAPTPLPTRFEPDVESLTRVLRRLYERRDELTDRAHLARRQAVAEHSLPAAGAHLRRRLEAHVERPFTIAGLTATVIPEPPSPLGIVLDARYEPEFLERALDWIGRMTRGPHRIVIVGGARPAVERLSEAFALLADQPYVAYLRSDVVVGRSWDDFLIDALRTRPRLAFVAARSFDVPGFQGQLGNATDPSYRDIESGGFTSFARTVSLTHTGHGTVLDVVSLCAVAFERSLLLEALERIGGPFESIEALARATLVDLRVAWCAQDAIVRHGGSGMRTLVELRKA